MKVFTRHGAALQDGQRWQTHFCITLFKPATRTLLKFLLDDKSKLHTVGTGFQKTDKEIFRQTKYPETGAVPEDIIYTTFSEDYKYIITYLAGVQNELHAFYALSSELTNDKINWKTFCS